MQSGSVWWHSMSKWRSKWLLDSSFHHDCSFCKHLLRKLFLQTVINCNCKAWYKTAYDVCWIFYRWLEEKIYWWEVDNSTCIILHLKSAKILSFYETVNHYFYHSWCLWCSKYWLLSGYRFLNACEMFWRTVIIGIWCMNTVEIYCWKLLITIFILCWSANKSDNRLLHKKIPPLVKNLKIIKINCLPHPQNKNEGS